MFKINSIDQPPSVITPTTHLLCGGMSSSGKVYPPKTAIDVPQSMRDIPKIVKFVAILKPTFPKSIPTPQTTTIFRRP